MDNVKDALQDAISYTDQLIRDERLRSDLRSAVGHGAEARDRVMEDIGAGHTTSRLAADKKLRKKLRAMLDDLESASGRMRRKRSHRVRNALLIMTGTGAAVAVVPSARHWIADHMSSGQNGGMPGDVTTT